MGYHEYIELGSCPYEEECVQVSDRNDYMPAMTEQCKRYKEQLKRMFPIPKGVDAFFSIKTFQHDFGSYKEVVIVYDPLDEEAVNFAYHVDENLPAKWDREALSA